jgi:hypothetical protein
LANEALSVKIEGMDRLLAKLDGHKLLGGPLKTALQKAALYVEGEARKGAKPHSVDTGELARSIKSELGPGAIPLHARVYSDKIYAYPAEFGRKPGKMPPVKAIAAWATRHGITIAPFVLARAIGKHGTKGLFYMKHAAEAGAKKIPTFMAEAAKAIEATWSKK